MSRTSRFRIFTFIAIALGIAGGLLAVELGMRIYGASRGIDYRLFRKELGNSDRLPKGLWSDDGTGLMPNSSVLAVTSDFNVVYRINSNGLRDVEHDLKRRDSRYRILALGDSFVFGEGVPLGQRFLDIASANLNDVEVINMGVPGFGIDDMLSVLVREGFKYELDHVVIILNGMDPERHNLDLRYKSDSPKSFAREIAGLPRGSDTLYQTADKPLFKRPEYWLEKTSYLVAWTSFCWNLFRVRGRLSDQDKEIWRIAGSANDTVVAAQVIPAEKPRTLALLRQMAEVCRKKHIRFSIVGVEPRDAMRFLAEVAPDVPYVDYSAGLREEAKQYSLRFVYDQHYNSRTNAYLGEKLTELFRKLASNKRESNNLRW